MLVSAVQRESAISIHLSPPSWACLPPPSPVFSFLIRLEKFHKGSRNLLDQSVPDGLNSPLIHQNRISWHSPQPASLEQTLGAIWSAVSQATVFILPQNNTWFASFTLYFFFFFKVSTQLNLNLIPISLGRAFTIHCSQETLMNSDHLIPSWFQKSTFF